ncbi:MAG: helix-turn-helix transcriptional regulator [Actinomycetota bacterium]
MKDEKRRGVPLKEWLDAELRDPEFKRYYDESSVKWHVAMQIVEARQKANMTQGELARQIGDRQQNVSRIESGEQNVTIGTLDKIAKAVGGRLVVKIIESKAGSASKGERTGASMVRDRKKPYRVKR